MVENGRGWGRRRRRTKGDIIDEASAKAARREAQKGNYQAGLTAADDVARRSRDETVRGEAESEARYRGWRIWRRFRRGEE